MKKWFFVFIVFGFFARLSAQVKPFEGTIVYTDKYTNKDTVYKSVYKIQKNKYKIELEGDLRYIILSGDKCRLYFPDNKTYYESTAKEQKKDKFDVEYWQKEEKSFKEGLTKETKTILGYTCQKITYFTPFSSNNPSNGGYRYEYWVIKDRTVKIQCRSPYTDFGMAYVDNCLKFGYIPLEYTVKFEYNGKEKDIVLVYEAIQIDENKLPANCVIDPKGYKKAEVPTDDYDDYDEYDY